MSKREDGELKLLKVSKNVVTYYKKYKLRILILYIVTILASVIELLPIYFFGMAIDEITNKDLQGTLKVIVILILLFIINLILSYMETYFSEYLNNKITKDIKEKLIDFILNARITEINGLRSGNLFKVIEDDSSALSRFIIEDVLNIIISVIKVFLTIIFIYKISLHLTIVSMTSIPLYFLISKIFEKHIKNYSYSIKNLNDEYVTNLQETMLHINEIKVLRSEEEVKKKFKNSLNFIMKSNIKLTKVNIWSGMASMTIGNIFEWAMLIISTVLIISEKLTLGEYVSFKTYAQQLTQSISKLANFKLNSKKIEISIDRINRVLSLNQESTSIGKGIDLKDFDNIKINNVTFKYENSEYPILRNLTMEFANKGLYGIVGYSGCGKSTLLNLIINLYQLNEGEILIENNNIDSISVGKLRSNIAYIQQDPYIFNGSIKDNLIMGNTEVNLKEIKEACKKANIYDFIEALPEKYDTKVGELSIKPSGGQKQRLAIARAILQKAKILLLDEITSDLDGESEYYVMQSLKALSSDCIIIMVAHRISTINMIDMIYVMDKGKIEGFGSNSSLMVKSSVYKSLFCKQADGLNENDITYQTVF